MKPLHFDRHVALRVILSTARITGSLYAGLVLLFLGVYIFNPTGDGGAPTDGADYVGLALYPFGVCVGLIAALRWPRAGGLVAFGCLVGFWAWLAVARVDRGLPLPIMIAFLPAILYVVHGASAHRIHADAPATP